MISLILISALIIVVIAKLHSSLISAKPQYLISAADLIAKWTSDNNWAARFSLLFLPLIFVYNLFAWVVFGLETIYGGFMKLIALLWGGLLWLWNEVAKPTVIWVLQMIWHYLALFSWRFFYNAFHGVREALMTNNIVFSAKRLFMLLGITSVVLVATLLAGNIMYALICLPVLYLFMVYSVMKTLANDGETGFQKEWIWPVIKKLSVYFGFVLAIVVSLGALTYYNDVTIVSGFGLTLSEVLVPVGFGLTVALLAAVSCVPAFVKEESGNLKLLPLLRMLLFRMPKLLYGAPFQLIGALIVSIIPAILLLVLNHSAAFVTGSDIEGWTMRVQGIGEHIPAMVENSRSIDRLDLEFMEFQSAIQASIDTNNASIAALQLDSSSVQQKIATIQNDRLHTHSGDFYLGENQFFSMPAVDNAESYKLLLKYEDILVERVFTVDGENQSVVANWQWSTPGMCTVEVVPVNACGDGEGLSCVVNVLATPKPKQWIGRPDGPTEMCSGKEATYVTQNGFQRYEWEVPEGVEIIESNANTIKVVWGNHSGTVRVRGFNDEDEPTLWIGRDVAGFDLPGKVVNNGGYKADERNEPIVVDRPFIFKTKEEGLDSLQRIVTGIAGLTAQNAYHDLALSTEQSRVENSKEIIAASSFEHVWALLAKLLGAFGLVLLFSVVLAPMWNYFTGYNYRLVGFYQQGEHYWEKLFREMRERNPVQPFMGWFVLAAASAIAYFVYATGVLSMIMSFLQR
jgi:hypothetical protein